MIMLSACQPPTSEPPALPLADPALFEAEVDGKPVGLYTLNYEDQLVMQVTNFGGRVVNLFVPDKDGHMGNIVLGMSSLEDYQTANERFLGAAIGRYGNRIAGGRFDLNGDSYTLAQNDGKNHLHGGEKGFDSVVWDAKPVDEQTLELSYTSPHLEEGYPGTLEVKMVYKLVEGPALDITYEATTDAPTVVNLTHHSFFNLAGPGSGSISDHVLEINADHYTPVDEGLIPTGEIASVDGTPLDFRTPTPIGLRVDADHEQLRFGRGYDHNWVLNEGDGVRFAARMTEPTTGRVLEVWTDEPGMQFYGGNFFDGSDIGSNGQALRYRESFALETQHYPDSPNQPDFPSTALQPGNTYRSTCIYRFGMK